MIARVVEARHLRDFQVWIRFSDGVEGEVDLSSTLDGPIFEPLKDPRYFAGFAIDTTLTWPNGADIAPETLHRWVLEGKITPVP